MKSINNNPVVTTMNDLSFFLERYDPLYNFYLTGFWEAVPHHLMRQRPHPRANSIAWNLWHITRVEDAGLNRFVTDGTQVLDDGDWMEKMKVLWRHHGTEMTLEEVDELSQRIDLSSLQGYSMAVQERTRQILATLDLDTLDSLMEEQQVRKIIVDEGLAHSNPEGFIQNYTGWSKMKCLMTFGLTHSWQHLGELEVLAALSGVEFD